MPKGLVAALVFCALIVAFADPGEEGHDCQARTATTETHHAIIECWQSDGNDAWQRIGSEYKEGGFINWDYDGPDQIDTGYVYCYIAYYLTVLGDSCFSDYSVATWFQNPTQYAYFDLVMADDPNSRPELPDPK